jgi:hypothetical protein
LPGNFARSGLRTETFTQKKDPFNEHDAHTESFDALPEPAKGYVYHRLLQALSGQDQSPDFARLSTADRRAILEILLATKPGLPEEWIDYAKSQHIRIAGKHATPGQV